MAIFDLVGLVIMAAAATPPSAPQAEPSCIVDALPPSTREALVRKAADGATSRDSAVMQESEGPAKIAFQTCAQKYEWSDEEKKIALQAFVYGLRQEASIVRLQANGLSEADARKMFESLPMSMRDAIFGKRPMTDAEMDVLRLAFERLVKRLDGPDGNALSGYVTARAGYDYYSGQLARP